MSAYYTITYIHRGETTERTLYLPGDSTYCLLSATLTLSAGASGTLEIGIPESNPAFADIQYMTDEVIFYRRGVELWRGRPVTVKTDFDRTGTLTVEGALSYLYDTWYPPYDYSGSPTGLLQSVLDNHNSQVPEDRQLQLGTVTVTDANDYIARSNQDYSRSLSVLTDKLVGESLGGYLRIRVSEGVRYLDYLQSYDTTAAQTIQLGVNLLDIAQTVDYGDLATVLLPLGARDEESGEQLTVESVNSGSVYVEDAAAVATYGRIVASNTWDDVTVAANLLTKAKAYLAQLTSAVQQVTVSAVDLALVSETEVAISLGDAVLIQSTPHGVNQYFELTEMTIHPLSPGEDTLTFGADAASMTEQQSQSSRAVQSDIASLAVQLTKVVATYVTTDYLSANYATITDLTAVQADITDLKATDAEITNLVATKADITDLTAAQADIDDLTADTANIKSILAGNVGTGTLQAIHLTGDNLVADDAIITDAMIASLTASKLTAGTIYTSLINVASDEDEHLLLDGAGLQLKDGAGTVRVQIGKDAGGDYSYYLWDASGNLMWSPTGVTSAGLGDGIIRDIAVAEDAAISGSKLDIASVAQRLNEDGSITVDATHVTLDETTLDVAYQTVTQAATQLESRTETLETGLAVVQGQITSKVWQSDITAITDPLGTDITTLEDNYSTLTQTVDGISLEVGNVQTTINEQGSGITTLSEQYSALTQTVDSISLEVGNIQIGGRNLARGTSSEWSDWWTPTADTSNRVTTRYVAYLPEDKAVGDQYAVQVEIEFSGVTASESGTFRLRAHGAVDGSWATTNVWYTNLLDLSAPPEDGVYKYSAISTIRSNAVSATQFNIGFRADYWGSGQMRWRCVKVERGNQVTDWTPAPEDTESSITDITAQLALKVDKSDNGQIVSMLNASADEINITGNRLVISSDNFALTADGTLTVTNGNFSGKVTAESGAIAGWTITDAKIYAGDADTKTAVMQRPTSTTTYVFAAGGTSHQSYADCPFRVTKDGVLYATDVYLGNTLRMTDSTGTVTTLFTANADDMGWIVSPGSIMFGDGTTFGNNVNDSSFEFSSYRFKCIPSSGAAGDYYISREGNLRARTVYAQGTPLHYAAGNSISNFRWDGAGYLTNGGASVCFTIPLDRVALNSPTVTLTSVNGFILRQEGNYTHGSAAETYVKPLSMTAAYVSGVGVRVVAVFGTTTNAVNNAPIGVVFNGTLTFS